MTVLLAIVAILAFPYIGLAVALPLGPWDFDAPLADLAALALVPLVAFGFRGETRLPSPLGFAALLLAAALALPGAADAGASLHFVLRKMIFFYLAYGWALPWVVAREMPTGWARKAMLGSVALASTVLLASSVGRIAAGNALWFAEIEGLTNNHKTLAVALAPTFPLLVGLRRGRMDSAVIVLAGIAIAASMSRTAWITSAVGLSFLFAWRGRTVASRRGVVAAIVIAGVLVALASPRLARSNVQLDAQRSRQSIDRRAWAMFREHPFVGSGAGMNVHHVAQTFPDYRVNGVDAHGVVQKVGSELGILGLVGYGVFVAGMAVHLYRRSPSGSGWVGGPGDGAWACFVALHANLLFSTETFSQTHWIPLALCWGLSQRPASDTTNP